MAVPVASSLSQACVAIREFLHGKLEKNADEVRPKVYFGSPKNSFACYSDEDDWINLFFYRIEPTGFDADLMPGDTGWLRLHCLITPVAKKIEDRGEIGGDPVSEGEQDLRLLGEVMRVFHEYPQQILGGNDQQFHFQAVFESLSIESINQIWSTQGSEVAYRPSVAYEFALAPLAPRHVKKAASPLVATILTDAQATLAQGPIADSSSTDAQLNLSDPDTVNQSHYYVSSQQMNSVEVNTKLERWAPYICFVDATGKLALTLNIQRSVLPATIPVLIAGAKGEHVNLNWNLWINDGSDHSRTWLAGPDNPVALVIGATAGSDQSTHVIDAQHPPVYLQHLLHLPANADMKQAVLSAVRVKDGEELALTQSNLLIINVYEAP